MLRDLEPVTGQGIGMEVPQPSVAPDQPEIGTSPKVGKVFWLPAISLFRSIF